MALVSVSTFRSGGSVNLDSLQTVTGTLTFGVGVQVTLGASAFPSTGKYAVFQYGTLVGAANISTSTFVPPPGRAVSLVEIEAPYIYVTLS